MIGSVFLIKRQLDFGTLKQNFLEVHEKFFYAEIKFQKSFDQFYNSTTTENTLFNESLNVSLPPQMQPVEIPEVIIQNEVDYKEVSIVEAVPSQVIVPSKIKIQGVSFKSGHIEIEATNMTSELQQGSIWCVIETNGSTNSENTLFKGPKFVRLVEPKSAMTLEEKHRHKFKLQHRVIWKFDFDSEFAETIKAGQVNSVTVFAQNHKNQLILQTKLTKEQINS